MPFLIFYFGFHAFTGDKVTGELADSHGWPAAVRFWASCAFAAAIVLLPLWRHSAARTGAER